MRKKIAIGIISLIFMLSLIFLRRDPLQQQKFDSTIHILIDRAPGGLLPGQALDVMGRRFQPLLNDYTLLPQEGSEDFIFAPKKPDLPHLHFTVIRDESTRAMKFLRGDADVLYDTLAISKTEWIKKQNPSRPFRVYSRSGLNLSFIGFSLHHPILKNIGVRMALAKALPVAEWAKLKLFDWVDLSTEFIQIPFNPEASKQELDQLGYPIQANGTRFKLRYHTTAVREGYETALLVQEALKKIGIEVEVVTLDNLLYFQKMRKGDADIFSARWFRFVEQESILDYLSTSGTRNYFQYSNPKTDRRLKKNPVLTPQEISSILLKEFPFFPLYNWKHGLILSPRIVVENETRLVASLDESFRFLLLLRLK